MNKLTELNLSLPSDLTYNWFDLVVVVFLVIGVFRGRKRGMSEELLSILQWLSIVLASAYFYRPFGLFLVSITGMSRLGCYITAYLLIAVVIKVFFGFVKRGVGEKLVGSDTFGRMEYYLGMAAGMLRYACMLLMFMAFLSAKYISEAELRRVAKVQKDNFGEISFPTFGSLQQDVFKKSLVGSLTKQHLGNHLIVTGPDDGKAKASGDGMGKRRERDVQDIIDGGRKN
ncbi:MAG: CvpA family protein [Verrucomicrobiota bacterium]